MKLLILDAGHCLSLALVRLASRRGDTELVMEPGLELSPGRLAEVAPDALVIPPMAQPISAEPAAVQAHAEAVESCLSACAEAGVPLVWCVSDQLYEDGHETAIDEHVIPAPRDESLRRLITTGDRIREGFPRHLIVRLGPLFALDGGHAWLGELLERLMAGEEVRAAEDVIFCPTSADAAAMALLGMLQQQHCGAEAWGAYHLAGTEPVSAYTFASLVRTQLETRLEGLGESVALGPIKALNHHHDQPLRRVLNCRRVLEAFGVHQKPWRLEVGLMLDAWCKARQEVEA
ncbi:sugar nucleotide-binding protein [Halomonas pacifica]|uniref:dTDP-4-dehydrorhamnose reductase n=1 Tax=Bisbaumannia pacifica TaxID=77098 RepID=A0ABD4L6E8_9GAMM|nr:sugar nucleotide-binding protein [Halomonas pacifica]MBH8581283.1 sugar nucleotide-binding protein [Halomonas pacifica]MDC8805285.1 sugar nucleotide-binding protein [Halomonas pacifica]